MIYGYARVSTLDQSLEGQQQALKAAGADKVFSEKMSGARSDRPQLAKMLRTLQPEDVVIVAKLDRLARSTRDLLNTLQAITERGAGFKVLDNPTLDTTSAHGRLLVNILAAIGEFERELIKARTDDGRRRAMARGVRFGRKVKLTPHQIAEALRRRDAGEALTEIARSYNVSHSTISRLPAEAGPTVGTGMVRVRAELTAP
jgi:DNA invertase Pin-like site-specific DNA recombinase